MLLPGQAEKWPTATAGDAKGTASSDEAKARGFPATLCESAQNWPSPRADDSERCGNHPGAADSLSGVTAAWPIPKARDSKGESQRGEDQPTDALANSLPLLCRPAAPSSTTNWPLTRAAIAQRWPMFAAESLGLLAPCDSGLRSLLAAWTPPSCPRLSPAFQWWLMRWPHPRAIYCASAGTEWTRWWQLMRSELSGLKPSEVTDGTPR